MTDQQMPPEAKALLQAAEFVFDQNPSVSAVTVFALFSQGDGVAPNTAQMTLTRDGVTDIQWMHRLFPVALHMADRHGVIDLDAPPAPPTKKLILPN